MVEACSLARLRANAVLGLLTASLAAAPAGKQITCLPLIKVPTFAFTAEGE